MTADPFLTPAQDKVTTMSESEIPWKQLIDSAPGGVCVLDSDGIVRYANAAALALLRLPVPQDTPAADWFAPLDQVHRDRILSVIEKGGQVRLTLPRAEHPHLNLEARAVGPIEAASHSTILRVARDFEVEAADTIAVMVHELRLPMTSILGYAKMLLAVDAAGLSDTQRQFLETINRNVERLNRDLSAVQTMTRLDRGKINLSRSRQHPHKVAARALTELQPLIQEKGHHVTFAFPDDLPAVAADAGHLEQVILILLDNAVKYTPPEGQIKFDARRTGNHVQIDIVDNGIGIPPADRGQIFSRFFRGDAEQIRQYTGLGLNLYIARRFTELQGGKLWFDSTPGRGSTFSLKLPIYQA
jgi:signal transduction histidine kinase